jgi:DNA-binding SARP family transcriptional activator
MTEFLLLGPFEGPIEPPGGKPKALLARLLLEPGRLVSTDTLIAALWERPPASAAKVLQAHISALRKVLGADAIETRAPGYILRGATSDLARFEQLTEQARGDVDATRRARLLREALSLWRGAPLAEFRREPFAGAAAARLEELRLDALVRRLEAEVELGEHARVVHELTELVVAEPLREEPRRLLMLALYRSGRQADALASYREGRRALVEELGIEPGQALQTLERAILRQAPELDLERRPTSRGPIVCVGAAPVGLLRPLDRELIVVELEAEAGGLGVARSRLERLRDEVGDVRTAAFTSTEPVTDMVRLATELQAELLVVCEAPDDLLGRAPCDVALANGRLEIAPGPVVVPFGGSRDEWPALELGAWLARAHRRTLRLVGVEASEERRDASRTLAAASLALQRFASVAVETALVAAGPGGVLAQGGGVIVASLPRGPLDHARAELRSQAAVPVLLVHGGPRPSGLAPDRTLTRFSWSLGSG